MSAIKRFVTRQPVPTYFGLVFALSWGPFLLLARVRGFAGQADPLFLLVLMAGPVAAALAGLLLTGLVSGRAGYRELRAQLLRWRVGVGWYAVALLTAPLLSLALNLALALRDPAFRPGIFTTDDLPALLLPGLAAGLLAGIFEEVGWTGFAIPRLRRRYGLLATALIVGVPWGAWHFPAFRERDSFSGALPLALLLVQLLAWLPPYRVLMVRVYDRTGSLLVAMLMHASASITMAVLRPTGLAAASALVGLLVWAAALWVAALAVVLLAGHGVAEPSERTKPTTGPPGARAVPR
jgi:membrane protease YdiL (CAAX protease family)